MEDEDGGWITRTAGPSLEAPEGRQSIARGRQPLDRPPQRSTKPCKGETRITGELQAVPQSFTSLHSHIVFSTKDRRPMIADDIRARLYDYTGGILNENDSKLLAIGGMPDPHSHPGVDQQGIIDLRCVTIYQGKFLEVGT